MRINTDLIMLISAIITPISLIVGWLSIRNGLINHKKTGKAIESLAEVVQTHDLPSFPHNISRITKFIRRAKFKIEIYVDWGTYGMISAPSDFQDYKTTVLELANKAKSIKGNFEFIFQSYKPKVLETIFEKQVNSMSDADFSEKCKNFNTFYNENCKEFPRFERKEEVKKMLIDENELLIENMNFIDSNHGLHNSTVYIERNDSQIPCFMWIVDEEEAIISFPLYVKKRDSRAIEYTLKTRDKKLIRVLRDVVKV